MRLQEATHPVDGPGLCSNQSPTSVSTLSSGKKRDAGLTVPTAHRYQKLAGLQDEQAQRAGKAAHDMLGSVPIWPTFSPSPRASQTEGRSSGKLTARPYNPGSAVLSYAGSVARYRGIDWRRRTDTAYQICSVSTERAMNCRTARPTFPRDSVTG